MSDEEMKKNSKDVIKYINNLNKDIKKLNKKDIERYQKNIDSFKYLNESKDFLEKVFNCEISIIKSDNSNIYDPENRAKYAQPLRPALYIE